MSDLVGNPEDRFSLVAAHIVWLSGSVSDSRVGGLGLEIYHSQNARYFKPPMVKYPGA